MRKGQQRVRTEHSRAKQSTMMLIAFVSSQIRGASNSSHCKRKTPGHRGKRSKELPNMCLFLPYERQT